MHLYKVMFAMKLQHVSFNFSDYFRQTKYLINHFTYNYYINQLPTYVNMQRNIPLTYTPHIPMLYNMYEIIKS